MDPLTYSSSIMPAYVPYGSFVFGAGVFLNESDRDHYLSSLDSDTRSYILNHPEEFNTRDKIENFVSRKSRS